ncbi:hypothetical protein [Streptomyces sp. NPDC001165]|uniref:hypothetical protein n=1 Tax=Streptomyces sp. NPDC001165 TaxID=3364546 RepID=UPI00367A3D81
MNHEGDGFDCPGCAWPDGTDDITGQLQTLKQRPGGNINVGGSITLVEWLMANGLLRPRPAVAPCARDTPAARAASPGSETAANRHLDRFLAIPYGIPRGHAAGRMPEMNVLCALGDYSAQSGLPLMKHVKVTIEPAT